MVKVLPNNFTLVESQRILTPAGEPLAITCSNYLLFIAVEECMIEAYDLCTLERLAQFRTVSPVAQIAYNVVGDCVVALERKHSLSHSFVRVYFKWRGLSADKPMRIRMAASLTRSVQEQGRMAAEIVELPSDSGGSISCLACCEFTGRIAVAMGSLLRVFYLEREEGEQSSDPSSFSLRPQVTRNSPPSPSHSLPLPLPSLPTPNIEVLLDIQTNTTQLEMVSIVGDYIAFISTNEARVVKLSLFRSSADPIPDYQCVGSKDHQSEEGGGAMGGENPDPCSLRGAIVRDRNFLLWSPSAVWEAEKRANSSSASHVTSHDFTRSHTPTDDIISGDHLTSGDRHMPRPPPRNSPLVGTVHLKAITEATSEKLSDRTTMEVLGPVEYVWGRPLTVTVNHVANGGCQGIPECRVLTMLYRRFSAEISGSGSFGGGVSSGLSRSQRAPRPVRVQGGGGLGVAGGWDGLHSVKLIPTFNHNSSSQSVPRQLVGVSCFLANRYHSYLYDVHHRCRLLSSFSFMEQSRLASCDGVLLHALSDESVETYTSRVFQAAIGNLPRGSAVIHSPPKEEEEEEEEEERNGCAESVVTGRVEGFGGEGGGKTTPSPRGDAAVCNHTGRPPSPADSGGGWDEEEITADPQILLSQPIPPPSLDLTLLSTSKFIGCCYLATSRDYVIVVTKAEADTPSGGSWLLQSLTLRKSKVEQLWNIYVLKLKSPISLYQQFMEFAETMKETSPPMRQHLLSEAHVLLRRQILQEGYTAEVMRWFQDNCFQLADSLCHYSRWNGIETHASHYFIMSGRPIVDIVRHILSTLKSDHKNSRGRSVLMAYLNLVLFEPRNADKQMPLLRPLADKVLEFYAGSHVTKGSGHVTGHVISVLLDSWLVGYSSERALSLLERQLETVSGEESCRGRMCHAMLCLKTDREKEARQGVHQMPKEDLEKWVNGNLRLVLNSETLTLTPLGKLVLEVQENCLLSFFLCRLKNHTMTFDDLCTLLKSEEGCGLAHEFALKHFLEIIILDKSKVISKATTIEAVILLVEILFARLLSETAVPNPSSRRVAPFVMRRTRHRWLDNVAPFGGGGEEGEGEGETTGEKGGKEMNTDSTISCSCSSHMTETVATRVSELLDTAREGGRDFSVYQLSLEMLTLPHLGRKKEACQVCLGQCPAVIVDFCQTLFPDDLDLWAWLLEQLLGNTQCEGDPAPLHDLYVSLYKEALGHVISLTTPHQFLSLLPPSGSVSFFLPFIHRSFKLHFSRATSDSLHDAILHPNR